MRKVHEGGGVVNAKIAEAIAVHGTIMTYEKKKLLGFDGHVELTHTWVESLLTRIKFVQCQI